MFIKFCDNLQEKFYADFTSFGSFRSPVIGIGHSMPLRPFPIRSSLANQPRRVHKWRARIKEPATDRGRFPHNRPFWSAKLPRDLRRLQPAMTDAGSALRPLYLRRQAIYLERSEEGVDISFINVRQAVEHGSHISRLPGVTLDCVVVGKREAVMHQTVACPHSPEWRGPHLVRGLGVFGQGQDRDAVSGTNIVQQEVAIRFDNFIAERGGNGEGTSIDGGARRGRGNGGHMTDSASNLIELLFTRAGCVGDETRGGAFVERMKEDESGDVDEIFRVRNGIVLGPKADIDAIRRVFIREESRGNSHFVKICVGSKRFEAAMLSFPTKTTDSGAAVAFEHRNLRGAALHVDRLCITDCEEGAVRDAFNVAFAQSLI